MAYLNANYRLNKKNNDEFSLLWCLIAYLHAAKEHPNNVCNYNKLDYTKEIKLPKSSPPYGYKELQKIQEFNKDNILFNTFKVNEKKFKPCIIQS